MFRIAVVEDEKNLAALIIKYLCAEGYEVHWYNTGEDAHKAIFEETFDLWILDIMLPGILSGYDLIKTIRANFTTMPVIFTSARVQDIDKIMGLEMGSDDYLAKPYSIRELVLRIRNLLSRTYKTTHSHKDFISIGEYLIDKERRSVMLKEKNIILTSKEYDLLFYLATNSGKAFSRDQILNIVWGEDYFGSDRVVDDLLRRLRKKMPDLQIETIYGYGYRLIV